MIQWATQTRQGRIARHLGLSVLVLLLLTIPFWILPIDLWIESAAWQGPAAGWSLGEKQPWKGIYEFGTFPALLFVIAAMAVAIAGFRVGAAAKWNKAAVYLILCMAVGPGIVVNLGFKDHWGRPRPREVTNFGGDYPSEKVWVVDPVSPGKSFPCGHCTMGFYFFAPGFLLWRIGRRRDAVAVFGVATVSGVLLGIARMLQGGHFPSDVLWGAGICWLVSLGLYYALQLDQSLTWELHLPAWAQRGPQQVATAGLSLAILSGLLLATPYRREERHELNPTKPGDMELSLILTGTRHRIAIAPQRQGGWIVAEGRGHGMPGSGVKAVWTTRQRAEGGTYFQFKQRMSGWLTELDQANEILVPDTAGEVRVVVQSGAAEINLRGVTTSQEWKIEVAKGARCDWTTGDRRGTLHSGEVFHWNPE